MKRLTLALVLSAVFGARSFGETIVVSEGATNSIVVGTNEAIIVDFLFGGTYPIFNKTGLTSRFRMAKGSAFAGPCGLVFDSSAVVTFHRVQTMAMTTVMLGANQTNLITVPTNKTLKIFPTIGGGLAQLIISRGEQSAAIPFTDELRSGCEVQGPLTVTMTGVGDQERQAFTYYFTDDFLQITAEGYIKSPTGTFEVLVEKSTDLAQWFPVMVQSTATADTRAFYRLRIQK